MSAPRTRTEQQRRRRFDLWSGLVMAVAGALLLGPYLRLRLTGAVVEASVTELVPVPVADGVRLDTVFEYAVPDADDDLRRVALGVGEIGIDGRRVPAPVVAPELLRIALDAFDRQWRDRERVPQRHALVLGDGTAGLLTESGAWRVRAGLVLILTPTILAAIRLLVSAFAQLRHQRRPTPR